MPDDYHQNQRINRVQGDANYINNHHHYPETPRNPFRPGRWGLAGGLAALLALGGTLATTQLSAKVYYCASSNTVKYHTDATCSHLTQCGSKIKSMSLSQARNKMDLCKTCRSN